MEINCYMNFKGNCREAITFYEKIFSTKAKTMTFGELPPDPAFPMNDEMKKLIMYGELQIEGQKIMFSDVMPDRDYICGNHISISLSGSNKEQLKNWFEGLAEGGEIEMPLEKTFWSEMYGFLTDRFGIGWQVNYSEGI